MRALILLGVLLVLAGGCSYDPGSFSYPARRFPGQRVTVGCLDISIDRRPDLVDAAAVLDYQFGNRCDQSVVVDLARVPVIGRTAAGEDVTLEAYDPGFEMKPLKLGARTAGGEAIAYPTQQPLVQICADAAAIDPSATERRWICFGSQARPENTEIAAVAP